MRNQNNFHAGGSECLRTDTFRALRNFQAGKQQAVLKHALADTVYTFGQCYRHQVIALCKQIVSQLYLCFAGGESSGCHFLALKKCGIAHLCDGGRQCYGFETFTAAEGILADCLDALGNHRRTKVRARAKSTVLNGFHAGGNGHGKERGAAERIVANGCHAGGNLHTEDPAVPESTCTDTGNAVFDAHCPDLAAVIVPGLFFCTAVIRYGTVAGYSQRA